MQNIICQDVLGIIIKQLPYDLKNIGLTCKYFHNTLSSIKKNKGEIEGNYILSSIQNSIISDLVNHTNDIQNKINPFLPYILIISLCHWDMIALGAIITLVPAYFDKANVNTAAVLPTLN